MFASKRSANYDGLYHRQQITRAVLAVHGLERLTPCASSVDTLKRMILHFVQRMRAIFQSDRC
jgi:hypothetical protein